MNEYEELRAGAMTLVFDRSGGQLRWFKYGATEVLRGIYGAVRDKNWGTISPRIEELTIGRGDDSFRITFVAVCQRDEIDYRWRGEIVGTADSTARYRFAGESRSTFLRNRIGLCVLHPIRECAGRPCRVLHSDGSSEDSAFPSAISPHQPFFRIAALRHPVEEGLHAEVRFHGDVFETEDQRNWTDASFKTYSTPLKLPFPVEVQPGDTVEQEVVVQLIGKVQRRSTPRPDVLEMAVGRAIPVPRIGFLHSAQGAPLNDDELERLAALRPGHIRVELQAGDALSVEYLNAALQDARRLDAAVQVVLDLNDQGESVISRILDPLAAHAINVVEWIVLDRGNVASESTLRRIRSLLSEFVSKPRVGAGTNGNFAELNRNRPTRDVADVLSYAMTPQAHAFDDATIMENITGQAETVRTTKEFAGDADLHVGPITLRRRAMDAVEANGILTKIPIDADLRQASPFLAAWALGSISALASEGVAAATYFELAGCRGIIGSHRQAQLPAPFGPLATAVYPVYHVFADLAEFHGGSWYALHVDVPDILAGLLVLQTDLEIALLANLTHRSRTCRLPFSPSRLRVLDHSTATSAIHTADKFRDSWREWQSPEIELPPHSYVRAEGAAR
jgi:hypothetical protein